MNSKFSKFLESSIKSKLLKEALSSGYSIMMESNQLSQGMAFLSKFPISTALANSIHQYALESVDCIELKHGDEPDSNFDEKELRMGIEVEKEHTDNSVVAEKIAKAHLTEDPEYYKKLSSLGL